MGKKRSFKVFIQSMVILLTFLVIVSCDKTNHNQAENVSATNITSPDHSEQKDSDCNAYDTSNDKDTKDLSVSGNGTISENPTNSEEIDSMENKTDTIKENASSNENDEGYDVPETSSIPKSDTEIVTVQNTETITDTPKYNEYHYSVFKDMYVGDSGIYRLHQEPDGNPICFDGGFEKLLAVRVWDKDRWIHYDYTLSQKEFDVYYNGDIITIEKDSKGNYYVGKIVDEKYYIFEFNTNRKLIKKLCVSDITNALFNKFYLLTDGKLLIKTFLIADDNSSAIYESYSGYVIYDKFLIIDMNSGKVIHVYDPEFPIGSMLRIKDKTIYYSDKAGDNIIAMDGNTGKILKIVNIENFDVLTKSNNYPEELGRDKDYNYAIFGNNMYFLKKSGIYKVNMDDGSWCKIINGADYSFFKSESMLFLDFVIKNDKEMYILAINYDEECATDFYKYIVE